MEFNGFGLGLVFVHLILYLRVSFISFPLRFHLRQMASDFLEDFLRHNHSAGSNVRHLQSIQFHSGGIVTKCLETSFSLVASWPAKSSDTVRLNETLPSFPY